ncbi:MAG: hypothetical protein CFE31_11145 [Rhizobiales bacterium PAR1]|nr:MAG: hypothetical protein CFE31_11145 [Rhizobiales bacterium PAR1]
MAELPKESLSGPVLVQVKALLVWMNSRHMQAKSLWRDLTSPVSADFNGVPHAGHVATTTEMREAHHEKGEADFADYYRWMQL